MNSEPAVEPRKRPLTWSRILAGIFDLFAAGIFGLTLVFLAGYVDSTFITGWTDGDTNSHLEPMLWSVFGTWLFIYLVLAPAFFGGTFGKQMFNIQVVNGHGSQRIGLLRALARELIRAMSIAALFSGYALAYYREDGRALHDVLAGTYVVDRGPEKNRSIK